jgi:hypothetical protein
MALLADDHLGAFSGLLDGLEPGIVQLRVASRPSEVGRLLAPDRQETLGIPNQVTPAVAREIGPRSVRVEGLDALQPLRRALAV